MIAVTLVTCQQLPEPDPDAAPLSAALDAAGISHRLAAWDDPTVDWAASPVTALRSTWNYYRDPEGFRRWLAATAGVTRLLNPEPLIQWNLHKGYLPELAAAGVPVIPTVSLRRGEVLDLQALAGAHGWPEIVIKPAISAGSHETHFGPAEDLRDTAARLMAEVDTLIQPFMPSVNTYGERSLIWIEGQLTHSVLKAPRFAGQAESVTGPHPIDERDLAVATQALAGIPAHLPRPRYARVDLIRDADEQPMLAELELIEPSLFFDLGGAAALTRYIEMLTHA